MHSWLGFSFKGNIPSVFGVDPMPSRLHFPSRQDQNLSQFAFDQSIDFRFIEGFYFIIVLMGISQHDLAEMVLRSHDMDPESIQFRSLRRDAVR